MASKPYSAGDTVNVSIESLGFGGDGVARVSGFVFFVPNSCPGDELTIEVIKVKKSHGFGRIVSVDSPSTFRVEPLCSVHTQCGGCGWQQVDYDEQVRAKSKIVEDAYRKAKIENSDVLPTVKSPDQFYYRNRIQLKSDKNHVGFFKKASHEIIPIESCPVAHKALNSKIGELTPQFCPEKFEIYLDQDFTAQIRDDFRSEKNNYFSQVNEPVNKLIISEILKITKELQPQTIVELYAGNGNISLPLATEFPDCHVHTVEMSENSVRAVLRDSPPKNLKAFCMSAEEFLATYDLQSESALFIIDPPRIGLSEKALILLKEFNTPILYLSCDPFTMARDVKALTNFGFSLKGPIQPFDMFPQTSHVETLALIDAPQ
jgi:23S rRNA (uracil1939-C5)-methyltransferase